MKRRNIKAARFQRRLQAERMYETLLRIREWSERQRKGSHFRQTLTAILEEGCRKRGIAIPSAIATDEIQG